MFLLQADLTHVRHTPQADPRSTGLLSTRELPRGAVAIALQVLRAKCV